MYACTWSLNTQDVRCSHILAFAYIWVTGTIIGIVLCSCLMGPCFRRCAEIRRLWGVTPVYRQRSSYGRGVVFAAGPLSGSAGGFSALAKAGSPLVTLQL